MIRTCYSSLTFLIYICVAASCVAIPKGHFTGDLSTAPDYSNKKYWAAHPEVKDSADAVPIPAWSDAQPGARADVFFIHPTSYIGKNGQKNWNPDIDDVKVNDDVDKAPIRYQATIFNGAGKIYAPRYRQAHLNTFFTKKRKADAKKALDLAYADVKNAFTYYLQNENNGRPFILAGHSQGSLHAMQLLHDVIDGTPYQKQLIVAYLPGWHIERNAFSTIKPCETPDETGCFTSWRTVKEGYLPEELHMPDKDILVTNPVTWKLDGKPSKKEAQLGGILRDFYTMRPALVSAWAHKDLLWVTKPDFPGSILLTIKNYHIADYNLFYADVRHNAQLRVKAYFDKH
jgi:hypothetical protein